MEHNLTFTQYILRITDEVRDRFLIFYRCHRTCGSSLRSISHRDGDRSCLINSYGVGSSRLPFARERMSSDHFRHENLPASDLPPSITQTLNVLTLLASPLRQKYHNTASRAWTRLAPTHSPVESLSRSQKAV